MTVCSRGRCGDSWYDKTGFFLHGDTFKYYAVFNSTLYIIPNKTCFCPLYKNMLWTTKSPHTILAQVDLLLAWTLWWLMIRKNNKTQTLFVINFKGKWYVSVRKCRLWRIFVYNRLYVSVRFSVQHFFIVFVNAMFLCGDVVHLTKC